MANIAFNELKLIRRRPAAVITALVTRQRPEREAAARQTRGGTSRQLLPEFSRVLTISGFFAPSDHRCRPGHKWDHNEVQGHRVPPGPRTIRTFWPGWSGAGSSCFSSFSSLASSARSRLEVACTRRRTLSRMTCTLIGLLVIAGAGVSQDPSGRTLPPEGPSGHRRVHLRSSLCLWASCPASDFSAIADGQPLVTAPSSFPCSRNTCWLRGRPSAT